MFKLLVLSCLLVSCLADPIGLPSGFREARHELHPQGCDDRAQGLRACARLNSSGSLVAHGGDCSLFFYCGGARPACRKCPAGLHFNPQLQVCDRPEKANCARHSPHPPHHPQPPQRPHPPHHPHPPHRPHPRPTGHPGQNTTTPYPTTPDDGATVTVTDGSTTTTTTTTSVAVPTTVRTTTDGTDAAITDAITTDGTRTDGTDAAIIDATTTDGTTTD